MVFILWSSMTCWFFFPYHPNLPSASTVKVTRTQVAQLVRLLWKSLCWQWVYLTVLFMLSKTLLGLLSSSLWDLICNIPYMVMLVLCSVLAGHWSPLALDFFKRALSREVPVLNFCLYVTPVKNYFLKRTFNQCSLVWYDFISTVKTLFCACNNCTV